MIHRSDSAEDTEAFGRELAKRLQRGDLVLLEGDLAAGKTTLMRGLVDGLGGDPGDVSSPTFVIIQSYHCPGPEIFEVHHVDLYRLEGTAASLRETGLEELLSDSEAIVAVEWPKDIVLDWLPHDGRIIRLRLTILENDEREIEMM